MENKNLLLFEKVFAWLLLIVTGSSVFIVIFTIASRIFYPYDLERMEGASLLQVIRILSGQALYVQPSIEYVPLIYPPIYFYISALATKLLGVGFAPLRLVSVMAFVGCCLVIFQAIKTTTKDIYASLIGAGFFAASYSLSGGWFDVARVDTLFVFFCILAIYFSARESRADVFLSSLFWLLAVFTKQTGIMVLLASSAYLLIRTFRRYSIRFALTGLGACSVYAICVSIWGKWFPYFFYYLPTFHKTRDNVVEISISFYQLVLPPLLAILIGMMPFLLDRSWWKEKPIPYYGFMTCVMFGFSLVGRLNLGSASNVYMPGHAMTAIMLGFGLNWWRNKVQTSKLPYVSLSLVTIYVICIAQFLHLYYDLDLVVPSSAEAQSYSRLEAFIRSTDGNVLAPDLNYLALLAGKKPFANQVALEEIFGEFGNAESIERDLLHQEIVHSLQEERFEFVLLPYKGKVWDKVSDYYQCFPFSEVIDSKDLSPDIVDDYQVCAPEAKFPK